LPRQDRPARRDAYRPLRRVLIVCEDEKSSKYYFDSFPVDRRRIDIRTVGAGRICLSRFRTGAGTWVIS
jgi:hypothetical protein